MLSPPWLLLSSAVPKPEQWLLLYLLARPFGVIKSLLFGIGWFRDWARIWLSMFVFCCMWKGWIPFFNQYFLSIFSLQTFLMSRRRRFTVEPHRLQQNLRSQSHGAGAHNCTKPGISVWRNYYGCGWWRLNSSFSAVPASNQMHTGQQFENEYSLVTIDLYQVMISFCCFICLHALCCKWF